MLKQYQIDELAELLSNESFQSNDSPDRFKRVIEKYFRENEDNHFELEKDAQIGTYGGESWIDDMEWAEYGIQLGEVSIGQITPYQMIYLAQVMVDHLLINGHKFEIQKTGEQDQRERLVCLDLKEDVE